LEQNNHDNAFDEKRCGLIIGIVQKFNFLSLTNNKKAIVKTL